MFMLIFCHPVHTETRRPLLALHLPLLAAFVASCSSSPWSSWLLPQTFLGSSLSHLLPPPMNQFPPPLPSHLSSLAAGPDARSGAPNNPARHGLCGSNARGSPCRAVPHPGPRHAPIHLAGCGRPRQPRVPADHARRASVRSGGSAEAEAQTPLHRLTAFVLLRLAAYARLLATPAPFVAGGGVDYGADAMMSQLRLASEDATLLEDLAGFAASLQAPAAASISAVSALLGSTRRDLLPLYHERAISVLAALTSSGAACGVPVNGAAAAWDIGSQNLFSGFHAQFKSVERE
ncbi:hypothetical protein PVAP13_3NG179900 [Panicum virgatum]|uniref:Uncharacterized protein n=1 Tax=Panicum virgatum TaxID=38727 RepID=A0A8T0UG64_PANVG|nr:hypothetical protein PVAP13_3NG179900 [Panicum virgatum]